MRCASTSPFISHGKRRDKKLIFFAGINFYSRGIKIILAQSKIKFFIALRLRFPWTPSSAHKKGGFFPDIYDPGISPL